MGSFVNYLHQNDQGIAFRIEWYMFVRCYTSDTWHCKLWLTQENVGAMKFEDRGFGIVQCPKTRRHVFSKGTLGELVFIRLCYITAQVSLKRIPQN